MTLFNWLRYVKPETVILSLFVGVLLLCFNTEIWAADLPFIAKTQYLSSAIAGPFMTAAGTILFVVTCLMAAFGEWGEGFKRIIQIVFWISLALAGAGVITWLRAG